MNRHTDANTLACLVLVACTTTFAANVGIAPAVLTKLEPAALAATAKARNNVYRIDMQNRSHARMKKMAHTVGIEQGGLRDTARCRYSQRTDTSRAGAWHNAKRGRYVCFRESRSELTSASEFPVDLNARATSLLDNLVLPGETYVITGMNAYVLQDTGDAPPVTFRRTYKFERVLDGSVVFAPEGHAAVQFDRHGRAVLAEIPAVTLTRSPIAEPVDPAELLVRLQALVATKDTVVEQYRTISVDSAAARALVYSYRKESRGGRDYLVPCQSVLVEYFPREREPVRREHHFSLDRASRRYELVDPWLRSK